MSLVLFLVLFLVLSVSFVSANLVEDISDLARNFFVIGEDKGGDGELFNLLLEGEPVLFLEPSDSRVAPGEDLDIDINLEDVLDLYGFQLDISYDPEVLELVGIFEEDFLNKDGTMTFGGFPDLSTLGVIKNYYVSRMYSEEGVDGSGTLARIRFHAKSTGNSEIIISANHLVDSNVGFISHQVNNAFVEVGVFLCIDGDNDGYGVCPDCGIINGCIYEGDDCNDANSNINPGINEVCNGIDDNCNSQIDEGVKLTFYRDSDSDGYGNLNQMSYACSAPSGYVSDNTDCNDANSNINPGETEICNGIDDNCNGQIDEGVKLVFYIDSDLDGYGNLNNPTQACSAPSGYVSDNTDCNDANSNVNPGETEICNGIDDNCNGQIDENGVCGSTNYYCDNDDDGFLSAVPSGSCDTFNCIPLWCYKNFGKDCDDNNLNINPGVRELCDGIDNNCDGIIDEIIQTDPTNCGSCGNVCDFENVQVHNCNQGICGIISCELGWVDLNKIPEDGCENECEPTGPELCDGMDNNCDGRTDEGFNGDDCEEKCINEGGIDFDSLRIPGFKCCGNDANEGNPFEEFIEISCEDNNDNDCDGQIDCEDLDCVDNPSCGVCVNEDVICDGYINMKDLVAVAVVFGTRGCEPPDWCNRRDVIKDGEINIKDLVRVVTVFD